MTADLIATEKPDLGNVESSTGEDRPQRSTLGDAGTISDTGRRDFQIRTVILPNHFSSADTSPAVAGSKEIVLLRGTLRLDMPVDLADRVLSGSFVVGNR